MWGLNLYHFIPKFHILDLLIVRDRKQFHRFGLHKIFQHVRDFRDGVGIEIIYGFVDKQNRGMDIAGDSEHPDDFQDDSLPSTQTFYISFSFVVKNLRQQFQFICACLIQRKINLILDDLREIAIDDIAQNRQMIL